MTQALSLSEVGHRFGSVAALSQINLTVEAGETLALIGPSGAGKSTLLALLDGRLRDWNGAATVLDLKLSAGQAPKRQTRADTGFIFQDFALVDRQSVYQNVMNGRLGRTGLWSSLWGRFSDRDHAIVGSVLRDTELADMADRRADQLSGGQRQRVAIARCLAQEPQLILADEPVSSLDPAHAEKALELITGEARKRGIAVIFASHQPELSQKYADRVVGLRDGRILFDHPSAVVSRAALDELYHGQKPEQRGLRVVG
jgi:phosphonate transport system ATP-binding protein